MASSDITNNTNENVVPLDDDDKHPLELDKEFNGATLEISGPEPEVRVTNNARATNDAQSTESSGFSRDRPGSTIGRTSVRSTSSRTALRPGVVKTENVTETYLSYKDSQFEKAIDACKKLIKPELDGEYKYAWLLTEIDHWDLEREKLVFLTENSVFIVRYNFITEKIIGWRRILLHMIISIGIGDFVYPSYSLMPHRNHGGIQIKWGKTSDLSFGQRWNPWCSDIPYVNLSHHPIIYNPKESETTIYNVDDFFDTLVGAISKVYKEKKPNENLTVIEGPIDIECYASLQSLVFNQSSLGFYRDRNGACF